MKISKILEKYKSRKVLAGGIVLVVIIVLYFAQVFYMGMFNKKIYEKWQQDFKDMQDTLTQTDVALGYFSISNESFEKGFFSSKASFDVLVDSVAFGMPFGAELPPINVKIEFKNNIFSSRNAIINVENPFQEIAQMLGKQVGLTLNMDKNFIVGKANISFFGGASIQTKINDIELRASDDEYLIFKDFVATLQLDSEGKVVSSHLDFGGFELKGGHEYYHYIKGVTSDIKFDKPASFLGMIGHEIVDYDSKSSMQSVGFKDDDGDVDVFDVRFDIKTSSDNADAFLTDLVAKAKTFTFAPVYGNETIELSNINANILIDKLPKTIYVSPFSSLDDVVLAMFSEAGTKVEVSDVSFYKGDNDFKAKGFVQGDKEGTQVNLTLTSNVQFSELLPSLFSPNIELPQNDEGRYVLEIMGHKVEELKFNGKSLVDFLGMDSEFIDEIPDELEYESKILDAP